MTTSAHAKKLALDEKAAFVEWKRTRSVSSWIRWEHAKKQQAAFRRLRKGKK